MARGDVEVTVRLAPGELERLKGETMVQLGSRVRDTITGFAGIATGRSVFLNGCVRVLIEGKDKDKEPKEFWTDEQRVQVLEAGKFKPQPVPAALRGVPPERGGPASGGGPMSAPPRRDPR